MIVQEQFESAEKLRRFSEELKAEKREWREFLDKALNDVEECKKVIAESRKKREQFMATLAEAIDGLMVEIQAFKNYDELVALSKQVLEAIREK